MKFLRATQLARCFQYEEDARAFYQALDPRLAKFNLEVADEKTRIFAFGRNPEENSQRQGGIKPDTFRLFRLHPLLQ